MRRLFSVIALGFLSVLLVSLAFAPEYEVSFTEEDIRRKVAAEIPHTIKNAGVDIHVMSASVDLRADNRIAIDADVKATGFTLDGIGSATINSVVRYKRGRFYLGDLTHGDLVFSFSESSNETIKDVTNTIRGLLEREGAEARSTGDVLKADRIDELEDYARQELKADASKLLDDFLQNIPIYDLNGQGAAMWLAALSIKSVTISETKVTAILSFQQLIVRLIVGALTILLVIALHLPAVTINVLKWLYLRMAGRKEK